MEASFFDGTLTFSSTLQYPDGARTLSQSQLATLLQDCDTRNSFVKVVFPVGDIAVQGVLNVPENVLFQGDASDGNVRTRFVLENSAQIVVKDRVGAFGHVTFIVPDQPKNGAAILIQPNASLLMKNCNFSSTARFNGGRVGVVAFGEFKARSCNFVDVQVVFEEGSSGFLKQCTCRVGTSSEESKSRNSKKRKNNAEIDSCAIQLKTNQEVCLEGCDIDGFATGVVVASASSSVVSKCRITAVETCLLVQGGKVSVNECQLSATNGRGISADNRSEVTGTGNKVSVCLIGITAVNGGAVKVVKTVINDCILCGVRAESDGNVALTECEVTNVTGGSDSDGIQLLKLGKVNLSHVKISGMPGYGVVAQDPGTELQFDDLNVSKCVKGGVCAMDTCSFIGTALEMEDNDGQNMHILGAETHVEVVGIKVKGGKVGIAVNKGPKVNFKDIRLEALTDKAIHIQDATGVFCHAHINQTATKALGIYVRFKGSKREKIQLQDCKTQGCSVGIKVEQATGRDSKRISEDNRGYNEQTSVLAGNSSEPIVSKCDIDNAAFIQCQIGFYVDAARVNLNGCSFIMSKEHSLVIRNQFLRPGQRIRKQANLRIRWPNYVEPLIDNADSISNDHQLLTNVTEEKAFFGSADFEPVMYINTLTERIRQARTLFKAKEQDSIPKTRVIMRSVSHMLILLKQLSKKLLEKELSDDPDLGMFAATFKLYDDRTTPTNTLVTMENLFASWRGLHRTRLFDQALSALVEAFQEKQVSEDLFDEWVTPLEEMQRACFVRSKYNRRRDYLLTTAKETPLTTWFFLDKESKETDEGKRLRKEVLEFLASDREENRQHNTTNFHASWVAQWAVHLMGDSFLQATIPLDANLRRAWAENSLDKRQPTRVLEGYEGNTLPSNTDYDELIKFECYKMMEEQGTKLSQAQLTKLAALMGGGGFSAAMQLAARLFTGEGALPGFLRRVAASSLNAESLLEPLSNVQDVANQVTRKHRERVVLAVISHQILPDSSVEPHIYRHEKGYETCEMCLTQKLQPWNELKLDSCKFNHRFCRPCMKLSMSTGDPNLWGICPGQTPDGDPCTALATRREMEMAGMDRDKIYNIIRKRVVNALSSTPNWKPCDAPGCIGGRSNVTKSFYSCRLCNKMVTPDGGMSDPTVPKRLLQGVDGTVVMRGEGVFRECYHCAVTYEKGNACSTITCSHCQKQFSMTWGPDKITHRFDEEGIGPQRYVPKVAGKLWELGIFKDRKGKPLKLGQTLTEAEAVEIVRRAKLKLKEYTD